MEINDNVFNTGLINGIILFFILRVFGDAFSGFVSPSLMRYLKNNDYVRVFLLYLILFFFLSKIVNLDFFSGNYNLQEVQKNDIILLISFIILVFIIMFTRQPHNFNIFQIGIILLLFILNETNTNYNIIYSFYVLLVLSLIIGMYLYYLKQIKDKGSNFSYQRFFIGNQEDFYS